MNNVPHNPNQATAVFRRAADCDVEEWSDSIRGSVQWWTLFSADRTPTSGLTVGVAEIPVGAPAPLRGHWHSLAEVYYILHHRDGEGAVGCLHADHGVLRAGPEMGRHGLARRGDARVRDDGARRPVFARRELRVLEFAVDRGGDDLLHAARGHELRQPFPRHAETEPRRVPARPGDPALPRRPRRVGARRRAFSLAEGGVRGTAHGTALLRVQRRLHRDHHRIRQHRLRPVARVRAGVDAVPVLFRHLLRLDGRGHQAGARADHGQTGRARDAAHHPPARLLLDQVRRPAGREQRGVRGPRVHAGLRRQHRRDDDAARRLGPGHRHGVHRGDRLHQQHGPGSGRSRAGGQLRRPDGPADLGLLVRHAAGAPGAFYPARRPHPGVLAKMTLPAATHDR